MFLRVEFVSGLEGKKSEDFVQIKPRNNEVNYY